MTVHTSGGLVKASLQFPEAQWDELRAWAKAEGYETLAAAMRKLVGMGLEEARRRQQVIERTVAEGAA